jgi:nitrite reductase (NADH) small subunit
MAQEHRIGRLSEIPLGEGRNYEVEGRRIAVFRTRTGQIFATQAECPHRRGPLADGLVGGTTVVCPLHDWTYDLATGAALAGDCDIAVYPVRVTEDGAVLLSMPRGASPAG